MARTTEERLEALDEMTRHYSAAKAEWAANPATTEEEKALRDGERAACWSLMAATARVEA